MSTLRSQLFTIIEPAVFNNTDSSYLDTALDNLEAFVRDQCKAYNTLREKDEL